MKLQKSFLGELAMRFQKLFLTGVTGCLLLGASAAQAGDVIFDPNDPNKATGIENLDVGGTFYNVAFTAISTAAHQVYGPFPGTFDFNTNQTAADAAGAVNNALNINSVLTVGAEGSEGVPFYRIGFKADTVDLFEDVIKMVIFSEAGKSDGDLDPWVRNVNPDVDHYTLGVRVWADFTSGESSVPPCEGDLNNDGAVDDEDFSIFIEDWGRTDCPL